MKFEEHRNSDSHTGYYQVTVDNKEWNTLLEHARSVELKLVNHKGFRKGNVPEHLASQYLSEAKILARAHKKFLKQAYDFMNGQKKTIHPYLSVKGFQSEITKTTSHLCVVHFNFDLLPHVDCEKWSKIKITRQPIIVKENEIAIEIEKFKEKNAFLELKDKKVAKGDTIIIDFDGFIDNKPFDGGKATNFQLEIGSNSMIPGFEDQIVGTKADEYRVINVTFPDTYHVPKFRNKKAKFDVFVHEVKIKVIPKLNLEFYKQLQLSGVVDKLSLKKHLNQQITADKTQKEMEKEAEIILEELFKCCTVKIPPSLREAELFMQRRNIMDQIKKDKVDFEEYLAWMKKSEKQFYSELDREALDRLKLSFILKGIGDELNITVNDADYLEFCKKTAQQQNVAVKKVEEAMIAKKEEAMFRIRNDKIWAHICKHVINILVEPSSKTKNPAKLKTASKKLHSKEVKKPSFTSKKSYQPSAHHKSSGNVPKNKVTRSSKTTSRSNWRDKK